MVGDGLQAAISALVALHNFQQNSHHMLLSNLTDQPLIAQLGKDVFRYGQNTPWNCMFQHFLLRVDPRSTLWVVWFTCSHKLSLLLGVKHVFVFIRSFSVSCLNMAIFKKRNDIFWPFTTSQIRNDSEFATFCTWALQM